MMANNGDVKISLVPHQPGHTYRGILKDVGKRGETNIFLDLRASRVEEFLKQAHNMGMMTEYHNYFITTLDLHTVDMQDFQHGRANISALRVVVPKAKSDIDPRHRPFVDLHYSRILKKQRLIKTEAALVQDAVNIFVKAIRSMNQTLRVPRRSCSNILTWNQGRFLLNHLKNTSIPGMSGHVAFDNNGFRNNFTLDVLELKKTGLEKVGEWNESHGLSFTRNYSTLYHEVIESLKNRTLKVTTILNPPYIMLKQTGEKFSGNDQFEGYCIDLLHEMSKILGFKYDLRLVRDSTYGSKNMYGEWNGMIRELVDREADLAVADLTITYEREEAVDFTMPFMHLGISILFKKPSKKSPKLFSFLAPLSIEVWIYMGAAYFGVSVLLFLLARFTPKEWIMDPRCKAGAEVLENQFGILNSFWFTTGSLMQQSSELTPRAISTRVLAAAWWFFTLIMISSYTANLAAFLTAERMKSPIDTAEDLSKQSKIEYGCAESSSTKSFFKNSKVPVYRRMWTVMETSNPSVFSETVSKGIERVLKGNFAFLMESTTIEYETRKNCDLIQIGGLLDSKGYGIATPPGSPYRTPFSTAILKLQEDGILHDLKERWWKPTTEECPVEDKSLSVSTNELGFANVGGVFVVLLAGLGCACIIVVTEFIWKTKYHRVPC